MSVVSVRRTGAADRPALERLWLLFRHDMSEFGGQLPNPDGTFRSERLAAAFDNPDWAAYLIICQQRPAGFAIVRCVNGPVRILNSFFIVRGARRTGAGLRSVRMVVAQHPGPWEVAFQDENVAAVQFWRRVATEIAGSAWTEERRPVPGHQELPPDVWISFTVPG